MYKENNTSNEDELFVVTEGQRGLALNVRMAGNETKKRLKDGYSVVGRFLPIFYMGDKVIADVCI